MSSATLIEHVVNPDKESQSLLLQAVQPVDRHLEASIGRLSRGADKNSVESLKRLGLRLPIPRQASPWRQPLRASKVRQIAPRSLQQLAIRKPALQV